MRPRTALLLLLAPLGLGAALDPASPARAHLSAPPVAPHLAVAPALAAAPGLAVAPALAVAPVPAVAPPAPMPAADSGYARFVKDAAGRAKVAMRGKQWDDAERAWLAVLELDPRSETALAGLVDVAAARKDGDAEAYWRRELNGSLAAALAAGDGKAERALSQSAARRAALDPRAGEAEALLADHRDALAEQAAGYTADGWHGNALVGWAAYRALTAPGSEAEAEADRQLALCLERGADWTASLGLAPDAAGGMSAEWIEEHDRRTATWNDAARWETAHYRIRTNAGWRLGHGAARVMEQVHAFYREVWGILPDPPPSEPDPALREVTIPKIDVNIYGERQEYLKKSGAPEWSGGVFKGSEVATYDQSRGNGKSTAETFNVLFHEASHQFMHVCVPAAPSFVNEGVACLFEGIEILPNGTIRRDLPVSHYLRPVVEGLQAGTLQLADVLAGVNATSNEPKFYAPRWGFFYFLRAWVDEQGRYVFRELLPEYIAEFAKGAPGDVQGHFEEVVLARAGVPGLATFEEFELAWRQFMLDLDAEQRSGDTRLDEYRKSARMAGLKKEWDVALAFLERVADLDPDDLDMLAGLAEACEALGDGDRATWASRRFLELSAADEPRRAAHEQRLARLDPRHAERSAARRRLVGGMAALALAYDRDGMPLNAMAVGHDVLALDPFEPSARALVSRLEQETGRSLVRWERLFNGFDLDGWYTSGDDTPFLVQQGRLVCDFSRLAQAEQSVYRTIFLDRPVRGDWSLEVRIRTGDDWQIAGVLFGATGGDRFQGVVLRHTGSDQNNVDLALFDGEGSRSFRGDGSFKASFDPTREDGVLLRVDVRDRHVSVAVDGQPVTLVEGGKNKESLRYPAGALRGDVGLISSGGQPTRFTDVRLLAGRAR